MISTLDHPVREAKSLLSYYIYCEPNASKHDCDILQNCVLYYVSIQFWNYAFIENNKTYVHSFGTSRSWTNLSQYGGLHLLSQTSVDCWMKWVISKWEKYTLQMFCLLNPQTNAWEPNPKTTSNDFNSWKSVTKIFCFHAISTDICLLF